MKFILTIILLNLLTFSSYSQGLQPQIIKYNEATYVVKTVKNNNKSSNPIVRFSVKTIQKALSANYFKFFVDKNEVKLDSGVTKFTITPSKGNHIFSSLYNYNINETKKLFFPPHVFKLKNGFEYEIVFYLGYYEDSIISKLNMTKALFNNKNSGTFFIGPLGKYIAGYAYDAIANTGKSAVSIKLYDLENKKLIEKGTVIVDGKNYVLKDSSLYKGADAELLGYVYFHIDLDEGESKIQIKNVTGYHNFKIGKMYFRKNWVYEFSIYLVRKKQD